MSNPASPGVDAIGLLPPLSNRISAAVHWLLSTPPAERGHVIPKLKRRFDLTALEACIACREAGKRTAAPRNEVGSGGITGTVETFAAASRKHIARQAGFANIAIVG